jgi:polyhydroxyalkanoate synthesis repressor PhaR
MNLENIRIIKRYPNRKLYDTLDSKYITLKKVAELIKSGEMVSIFDNNTQEDITHDILFQIIRNQEKRWKLFPLKSLVALIRGGTSSSNEFLLNFKEEIDQKALNLPKINNLKDIIENYHSKFDEWQGKIEEQIHSILDAPSVLLSKELEHLGKRLLDLESLVNDLKSKLDK